MTVISLQGYLPNLRATTTLDYVSKGHTSIQNVVLKVNWQNSPVGEKGVSRNCFEFFGGIPDSSQTNLIVNWIRDTQ